MNNNSFLPLVSVVVITYNSSETVIETLESIKSQTYQNIELIVSDDCSTDDTVKVCQEWINVNADHFVKTELVTAEKNTGVSGNLNRGIRKSHGEWIKSIAGDDLLIPTAIEEYVKFVDENRECQICVSKLLLFGTSEEKMTKTEKFLEAMYSSLSIANRKLQYRTALKKHILPGPGIFYRKKLWELISGFDESYPFTEEWPFEIKVLSLTSIFLLKKKLVKWRQRPDSLCHLGISATKYQNSEFYWDVRRNLLKKEFGFWTAFIFDLHQQYRDKRFYRNR